MLNSVFLKLRGRTALWLVALYSLFYYPSAMALDALIPNGGIRPNMKIYYSLKQDMTSAEFTLRGVEMIGGFRDETVKPCGWGGDPIRSICVISLACGGYNGIPNSPSTLYFGYRPTDRQIYDALLAKVGQRVWVFDPASCMDFDKPGRGGPLSILASVVRSDAGEWAESFGTGSTEKVPEPPTADPECTITANGPGNSVVIDYGTVLSTTAHNLEKSEPLRLSCKRDAFVKISLPSDVVSLRTDNSLSAQIEFNKPSAPQKVLGSMGIFAKMVNGESTSVNVISTLKVKGALEGGAFNGSTVIKIEYL